MKKIIGLVSVGLTSILVLFLWLTTIHESVEVGSAYGFEIGTSKIEVITRLKTQQTYTIEVINLISANRNSKLVSLSSPLEYYTESDWWGVMFESPFFFDSITFEFCDEKLCRIYRERQYFETP